MLFFPVTHLYVMAILDYIMQEKLNVLPLKFKETSSSPLERCSLCK